jgi:heme-degrading monooxygenase HmoA
MKGDYLMAYLLVRHKIENYARWRPIFDDNGGDRKANGSKGGRLFRNAADPNEMVILFEWDDIKKAQQFAQSPELRAAMERAGVVDRPDIYFLEEIEKVPV